MRTTRRLVILLTIVILAAFTYTAYQVVSLW